MTRHLAADYIRTTVVNRLNESILIQETTHSFMQRNMGFSYLSVVQVVRIGTE